MKIPPKDGGRAFPVATEGGAYLGMSLRDYFAATALLGLIGCDIEEIPTLEQLAGKSYELADAMLIERAKP